MVASCAPHWGALLVSMHSFQARPGLPVSAWGRESAPLLHVSGTVPGAANRMHNHGRKTGERKHRSNQFGKLVTR